MQELVFLIQAGFFLWLLALSIILFVFFRNFKKLTKNVDSGNLITILEKVLEEEKKNTHSIKDVYVTLQKIEEQGKLHIQKVNLLRFNPFKELGGDHSFALTLLDANDNGVIITGLHTRERTRVYIRGVNKGKTDVELSKEEKKSLELAQRS